MIAGVADTHAALWYLHKNPRLSPSARTFMEGAVKSGDDIVLSSISLAEIVYLVERNRLPLSAYDDLRNALADPSYVIREAPLTAAIVDALRQVPRSRNGKAAGLKALRQPSGSRRAPRYARSVPISARRCPIADGGRPVARVAPAPGSSQRCT